MAFLELDTSKVKTPWYGSYEDIPEHLDYPDYSIYETIRRTCEKYPNEIAYDYFNRKVTYGDFLKEIDMIAKSFVAIGVKKGDKVTLVMPNTPEAIISFYALNKIGAISNMVHPLSSQNEIRHYIELSKSVAVLTIDATFATVYNIVPGTTVQNIIVASPSNSMIYMKPIYKTTQLTSNRIPREKGIIKWWRFRRLGRKVDYGVDEYTDGSYPATILYSGGTTGKPKGIVLSNLNFNALALSSLTFVKIGVGDKILAIMPIFHGFGLGVCVHTCMSVGAQSILIPRFDNKKFHKLLKKHKPTVLAGVPTLWEAMINNPKMKNMDLSFLKIMISGGDSLSVSLKHKMDAFLKEHNADIQVMEGYGLTECVTGSCLNPQYRCKDGSVGIPYPDIFYKIVKPNTCKEIPYGEEGEICLSGPTVMLEYLDEPEETANTLKVHEDGLTWLHTGDLGHMDEEGWVYFKLRIKRMIVSNGYNIYPSQLENIIDAHPNVSVSTVIGIPHPYKREVAKAFIVLKDGIEPTDEVKQNIYNYCKQNIAKYALPKEFEYRDELPKTLVNKVDVIRLMEESINGAN
ncbi:class I adenylate-forming enzyme family protein [uncultured Methanobrevibacter sp.]|uniref:class I adenylate-forming enzyme family protein n=1 Tax=uncultured Methanobrevibacter sp. TaxID=253161 RepID=UPI0025D01D39|nr:AMP-binding protein [uncultured Methanobrevibacter sp.]MCI6994608.1 AMP-binding protein [Methanobrevibacter sp.]